jgi:hypothetical protein
LRARVAIQLLLCAGGAGGVFVVAPPVVAQSSAQDSSVAVNGSCPLSADVGRVLATLLPAASHASVPVVVTDLGDAYRVEVGGRAKTYADPARNCDQRSRIAAAFIALALAPEPVSSAPDEATLPKRPAPPAAAAAAGSTPAASAFTVPVPAPGPAPAEPPAWGEPWWGHLEVRGEFLGSPEPGLIGAGVVIRGSAGVRAFGAHLLCGWLTSTSADLPGRTGSYSIERWPCAIGATARLTPSASRFEVAVDAGVALGVMQMAGHGFFQDQTATRLEVGARAGLDAVVHLGKGPFRLAPLVGIDAEYFPAAYHLTVGTAQVAESPHLWLGLTAGARWALQ